MKQWIFNFIKPLIEDLIYKHIEKYTQELLKYTNVKLDNEEIIKKLISKSLY